MTERVKTGRVEKTKQSPGDKMCGEDQAESCVQNVWRRPSRILMIKRVEKTKQSPDDRTCGDRTCS